MSFAGAMFLVYFVSNLAFVNSKNSFNAIVQKNHGRELHHPRPKMILLCDNVGDVTPLVPRDTLHGTDH